MLQRALMLGNRLDRGLDFEHKANRGVTFLLVAPLFGFFKNQPMQEISANGWNLIDPKSIPVCNSSDKPNCLADDKL